MSQDKRKCDGPLEGDELSNKKQKSKRTQKERKLTNISFVFELPEPIDAERGRMAHFLVVTCNTLTQSDLFYEMERAELMPFGKYSADTNLQMFDRDVRDRVKSMVNAFQAMSETLYFRLKQFMTHASDSTEHTAELKKRLSHLRAVTKDAVSDSDERYDEWFDLNWNTWALFDDRMKMVTRRHAHFNQRTNPLPYGIPQRDDLSLQPFNHCFSALILVIRHDVACMQWRLVAPFDRCGSACVGPVMEF